MKILALILWLCPLTAAALQIPKNLTREDRSEVIRILGISTSGKNLSNPYPLGGFSGLEVGVSLEIVNSADLSRLGDKTDLDPEFRYPRVTIGKGLYSDVDVFVHFIPYNENSNLSEYGGMVRWSFYEARFLPVNFSLLFHGSHIDINDAFNNQTLGLELMCGINANDFALYFGIGQLNASGEFKAAGSESVVNPSDPRINPETQSVRQSIRSGHSFVGFSYQFSDFFAAAQIDRYEDVVYSAKLGIRF